MSDRSWSLLDSASNRLGGLPRAPDGTGRLSVIHPGRPKQCSQPSRPDDRALASYSQVRPGQGG